MRITNFKRIIWLFLLFAHVGFPASAANKTNAQQAKELFYKTWNMVTSPKGFTVKYAVNIIGLYKTQGQIWAKGKKQHYEESRYWGWSDEKHFYKVDNKKRTVDFHNPASPKRDKYLSKFTFVPSNYDYSWESAKEGIVININAHKDVSGVKHAKVIIDRKTRYPIALRIKLAFFWTTVKLTGFHPSVTDESIFRYPSEKYTGWKFVNHWPD